MRKLKRVNLKARSAKPLTDVINATIDKGIFPSNAKLASVKPTYKKGSRLDVSNYRPISVKNQESRIKNYFAKREHTTIINITKE